MEYITMFTLYSVTYNHLLRFVITLKVIPAIPALSLYSEYTVPTTWGISSSRQPQGFKLCSQQPTDATKRLDYLRTCTA